jgi:beta-glucosidase
MMRAWVVMITALLGATVARAQAGCPDRSTPALLEQRVAALLAQMSPAEKIAQLEDNSPAIPRLGLPGYNWWNEGLHGIARNGYATVFPQAIGMAATWDPELLAEVGDVVATEARAKYDARFGQDAARYAGLTVWSPNINIFRDPRWGRGQETYGEDPYMTGLLATRFVEGVQGTDPFYLKADATPKHFAVHSGPERTRDGFNSIASEHDLADTYLPAFRAVLTAGRAAAMMCSYNRINGTPSCADSALLEGRVRSDWKFSGYVVSDCDAVANITHFHHWTPDDEHGAAAALKAGTDLNCGSTYKALQGALAEGLVSVADLDRALSRLLMARLRLGVLDAASCGPYGQIPMVEVDSPAHRALALRAARESIVLLANDGLLPMRSKQNIAVIGPTADLLENVEGNYHGTAVAPVTPLDGLLSRFAHMRYAQGSGLAEGLPITIPRTALRASGAPDAAEGLTGEYYDSAGFVGPPALTRTDARLSFDFNRAAPVPALQAAQTSVRWTGLLRPPAAGEYIFSIRIDYCYECKFHDSYKLFLGDTLVLAGHGAAGEKDSVSLDLASAAPLPLRLELEHRGDEGIALEWEPPASALLDEAAAAAAQADVIVAMVGLSPDLEGEALKLSLPGFDGGDRTSLALPEAQRTLLDRLQATGKPLIVVIASGSAVSLDSSLLLGPHKAAAVLAGWYGGQAGGTALAEILSGLVSPSGRLPVTFYRSIDDLPAFDDYRMAHRTYRYYDGPVQFPFGYGLSYAKFTYGRLAVDHAVLQAGEAQRVRVTVRNKSKLDADEVAELYLVPPRQAGSPRIALAGVERVHLRAGEKVALDFMLAPRQLGFVDEAGKRAVRAGTYTVFVGSTQPDSLTGQKAQSVSFVIKGEAPLPQ